MYYLVSVDHNGMVAHLTRRDCEGSGAVDGDVRGECGEDEGTDCEDRNSDTNW
jgi:hypothetical protein